MDMQPAGGKLNKSQHIHGKKSPGGCKEKENKHNSDDNQSSYEHCSLGGPSICLRVVGRMGLG